jgi:charged multivesicular body protein 4
VLDSSVKIIVVIMHLFARSKKPTPKEAIVKLRETLLLLEKRESFLQSKIDAELRLARENATKNKRSALMALKRKKQYEDQIERISGTRMTIETQVMAIENANVNLETMKAMKAGAQAMQSIHGEMNIDKVDKTMDEIRDQMDLANEISDAISQGVSYGTELDEEELNAELELLEQEELEAKLLNAQPVPSMQLPSVPVKAAQQTEEDELEELRASLAV